MVRLPVKFWRFDRRGESRDDDKDRRRLPRPPLWLNLFLLLIAVAALGVANVHQRRIERRFSGVFAERARTPEEINQVKAELADADLSQEALEKELQGRLKFTQSLKSEDFYLGIDTQAKKLRFYYGNTVLREGDVEIGEGRTIAGPDGKSWTFVPVKGAFPVEGKLVDHSWAVPEWLYVMNQQPIPKSRPSIKGGIGEYVILLGNGYVIHTRPVEASPLKGPKPGSIMAGEADLRAIWSRIHKGTPVYVF